MKRLFLLTLLLGTRTVLAQHAPQVRVGWNVNPLLFRTLELSGEYRPRPHLGYLLHGGYTDRNRNEGFPTYKINDFIRYRVTSGGFIKLGGRIYWNRRQQPESTGSLFTGLVGVMTYSELRYQEDFLPQISNPELLSEQRWAGLTAGGGLTLGYNISSPRRRLGADLGVQYTIHPGRSYPGRADRNYLPGFGRVLSGQVYTSLQGIFALNYRL
jgi:hypothetical protein